MFKKILKISIALLFAGYVGFCAAVYFFPDLFFYNPSNQKSDIAKAVADGFPAHEATYKSADGTELYGWYVPPASKSKIIVF